MAIMEASRDTSKGPTLSLRFQSAVEGKGSLLNSLWWLRERSTSRVYVAEAVDAASRPPADAVVVRPWLLLALVAAFLGFEFADKMDSSAIALPCSVGYNKARNPS
jgi:hypothetical protein